MEVVFVITLGLLVGLSAALLGLGGNILIVPLLPLVSGLELITTIATGIFAVLLVTLINVIQFSRQGLLDFKLISKLLLPVAIFSFVGSHFSGDIPVSIVKSMFLVVLVAMLLRLLFAKKLSGGSPVAEQNQNSGSYPLLLVAGSVSGAFAGVTGVGIGVILAPLLLTTSAIAAHKVSPTINFLIMASCFVASLNYLSWNSFTYPQWGQVRLDYAWGMAVPAMVSGVWGRRLNARITIERRKWVVGLALLVLMLVTILV